jgi:hypothetical protein
MSFFNEVKFLNHELSLIININIILFASLYAIYFFTFLFKILLLQVNLKFKPFEYFFWYNLAIHL